MARANTDAKDPFHLDRFLSAQERSHDVALAEVRSGRKRSHWMWYVFPQIEGLGHSSTAEYYAIKSRKEAQAYLDHPVLGRRIVECAEAVLGVAGRSASEIFGYPDDLKLRSSMTLFAEVAADSSSVFRRVLDKYFNGEPDRRTIQILAKLEGRGGR